MLVWTSPVCQFCRIKPVLVFRDSELKDVWTVVKCFTENRPLVPTNLSSCSILDFVSWLTWVNLHIGSTALLLESSKLVCRLRHGGATFRLSLNASVETDDQCRLHWNTSSCYSRLHRFKFCFCLLHQVLNMVNILWISWHCSSGWSQFQLPKILGRFEIPPKVSQVQNCVKLKCWVQTRLYKLCLLPTVDVVSRLSWVEVE